MSMKLEKIDICDAMTACNPLKPWNELPLLPPAKTLETHAVLKACIRARTELASLKSAAALIPNQSMLINTLPLLEAKDSSEIESIVTTTDKLFQHAGSESSADPATKEALRYRTALHAGYQNLRQQPLSTRTAVQVCSTLKGVEMDVRSGSGTQLINDRNGQVIYTPPEGQARLRDMLANWERFLHQMPTPRAPLADDAHDLDPLVRMAVAHYQFEAIHPFSDGNGRTGRIINLLYLVQEGLLDLPILYLSRFIIARKADYYRLLAAVTFSGAWQEWIVFMLRGVEETAGWTSAKINAMRQLFEQTAAYARQKLPGVYSHELIEVIFSQPYCRIANLQDKGIAKRQTGARYLKEMTTAGILREISVGREKLFINPRLMQLLQNDENEFSPFPEMK